MSLNSGAKRKITIAGLKNFIQESYDKAAQNPIVVVSSPMAIE